jgi:GNAT superfamily N-acetyltransferase
MGAEIRPYRPEDLDAVYDICVRTAARGGDATGVYLSDDLMPDAYAGPYLELTPELAFVVDDGGVVGGYVVGCADTAAFVAAYQDRWVPRLTGKYPPPAESGSSAWLVEAVLDPSRMLLPEVAGHPAHLHIDLLPPYQGGGYGRALIETFLAAVAAAGAPAVHLSMDPGNTRAHGFYLHLGFRPIEITSRERDDIFLGRPTS